MIQQVQGLRMGRRYSRMVSIAQNYDRLEGDSERLEGNSERLEGDYERLERELRKYEQALEETPRDRLGLGRLMVANKIIHDQRAIDEAADLADGELGKDIGEYYEHAKG